MFTSSSLSGIVVHRSPLDLGCGLRFSAATDPVPHPHPHPHSAGGADIGMVVFLTHKKEQAEAILDREGTWRCPRLPVLDRVLNALHEPRRDRGGDLPFGHAELIRVAAWFKGVAWFHCSWPDDRGGLMGEVAGSDRMNSEANGAGEAGQWSSRS
jgi:hypothetical protein